MIESPLKFATTAISCFGDGKGFAVGSIEGRCGIVNLDFSKSDMGKGTDFCFKCHREEHKVKKGEGDVYQINGISFNKAFNTFSTCGADGIYYLWNKDTKSKLK